MNNEKKIIPYYNPGIRVGFYSNTGDKNDEKYFDVNMTQGERSVYVNIDRSILRTDSEIENEKKQILNEKIKKEEEEKQRNFIKYRDSHLSDMNEFCKEVSRPRYRVLKNHNNGLKYVPKCLIRKSRKICKCKPECVVNIWKDYKFDESCKFYDLENIDIDDSCIDDCNPVRLHSNEPLEEEKHNPDNLKSEFVKDLDDLCDNTSLLSSTKCKAYQLRDECRNDSTCLKKDFLIT